MTADRLTQLQRKLASTNCPHCHHTLDNLVLRCDAFFGSECAALSECAHCRSWVDLEQALTMDEEFVAVSEGARSAGCPTCRSHDLRIDYRCEIATRECFYEATCRPAGHRHRI